MNLSLISPTGGEHLLTCLQHDAESSTAQLLKWNRWECEVPALSFSSYMDFVLQLEFKLSLSLLVSQANLVTTPTTQGTCGDWPRSRAGSSSQPGAYYTRGLTPSNGMLSITRSPTLTFNTKPSSRLFLLVLYLLSVKFVLFKRSCLLSLFLYSLASHSPTSPKAKLYLCQLIIS